MKNLTRKSGLFAAAAVLLVTAMLVTTGCSSDIGKTDEFTPPEGKGAVKLDFNKKIARTILPDEITDISYFDEFDFVFTATSVGATSKDKLGIDPANGSDNLYTPIVLDPGTYTLTVIAYKDSVPLAKNDPEPVTITPATVTGATIVLKPMDQATETGNGTFKYKITSTILNTNLTSALLSLTPIYEGAAQSNIDISAYWNGAFQNLVVKAGDYYLDFEVKVKTGETVTFRHIAHIYQGMTSTYEFTINPDYFNAYFTLVSTDITYSNIDDNLPSLTAGGTPVNEGDTVVVELGDTVTIAVTNGTACGFTSYEWYTQNLLSKGSAASYVVDTTTAAFLDKKTYLLTVVGVVSADKKYYTYINIKVVESPQGP